MLKLQALVIFYGKLKLSSCFFSFKAFIFQILYKSSSFQNDISFKTGFHLYDTDYVRNRRLQTESIPFFNNCSLHSNALFLKLPFFLSREVPLLETIVLLLTEHVRLAYNTGFDKPHLVVVGIFQIHRRLSRL